MALSGTLLFFLGVFSVAERAFSICVPPIHCIEDLEDIDTQERFDYVVAQYQKLNIEIEGKPIGLHGKVVTYGNSLEYHLVFHYVDNTLNDVIQTCTFVVSKVPEMCEGISTYCSGFLRRPPRPLLELKPLSVCKNDVHFAEEDPETTTELEVETKAEPPKEDPNAGASTETSSTKEPYATTIRLDKFRMFN